MRTLKAQISGVGKNKLLQATVLEVLGNRIAVQLVSNGKKLIGIPFVGGPISIGKIVYINYASGSPVAECRGEETEFTQTRTRPTRTVRTEFTQQQVGGAGGTGSVGLHAPTHASGGADPVKLDDLAAPDDNTDLNASASKHGLLPKLGGGTANFLRADGTWAEPAGGSGGDTWTINEDASAECDNSQVIFLTADDFISGSTVVYLNGLLQQPGVDYNENVGLDGITFDVAPLAGDVLLISYKTSSSGIPASHTSLTDIGTNTHAEIDDFISLSDPDSPPTDGQNPSVAMSYTGDDVTQIVKTVGGTPYTTDLSYTYDGDGNLTQLDKTIDTVTYRKTFTWVAGELTNISAWSIV